jgi:hypothetical protein
VSNKLKCNRNHIYGLNWVLINKVKRFKILYTVICLYCKIRSYKERESGRLLWVIRFVKWRWCTVHTKPRKLPKPSWMKYRFCFPWQTPQNVALGVSHFSLKVFHSGRTPSDDPSVSDARHTCQSECGNDIRRCELRQFHAGLFPTQFKRLVSYFPTCPWGDGQVRPVSHWPPHLNGLRNRVTYLAFIWCRLLAQEQV